jgi:class 3 adenylate cyclase/predicted ATPase
MQPIAEWLKKLGMSEYLQRFVENRIDLSVLPDLTDQDLEKLGVLLGDRRKMLRAIRDLGSVSVAPTTPSAPAGTEPTRRDDAERRQLTVMFTDLVGSTALSTKLDPEDMRFVIGVYHKCVAETVARFDGFVAKYMGDGVLVYFGYPHAHEDDAERAVRAGLALIEAVSKLLTQEPLQVRIGVATGLVVVGDLIGSGEAQERGVVGETPNLAARLQGIAAPDTVVIAEGTRRLLGNLFELEDLGLKDLKGIAGSARAWAVLRARSVESRFEALHATGLTALVGRDEETELLLRRWARAKTGEGQVVLIGGEAGIGKSRLTATLLERLATEPHTRLRYFCSPQHTDSALYPIIGQMERAAALTRDDTPQAKLDKLDAVLAQTSTSIDDASLFAEMLSLPNNGRYPQLDLTPQRRRQKTLEALISQLETLARQSPVLMIFEDAHWIDPTSLELFDRVVDRVASLPVLLIVTFRPEFNPPWIGQPHVTAMTINRLTQRHVGAMIDGVVGNKLLPASVRQDIIERTDGIPLFVEEMTKAVLEAEDEGAARRTVAAVPSPALAVPASLHASLMSRLDRLGPAKEVAQIGAAAGREFSHTLLASVVRKPEAELASALNRVVEAGLLFRQGVPPHATYLFKHALVQDAAYGTLLREPRRALHARIAKALADTFSETCETQPEILAHHYAEAGQTEAAIEWWGKAGERAIRGFAYKEASAHIEKALSLAKELSNGSAHRLLRLRLQLTYGNALRHALGFGMPETITAFLTARELAAELQNVPGRFRANYGIWSGGFMRGELILVRETAQQLLLDTKGQPRSPEAAVAHRAFGMTCWFQGNFVEATEQLEKTLNIYDGKRDRELAFIFGQDIAVAAMCYLSLSLWALGAVDRARLFADQAIARAVETEHMSSVFYAHVHKSYFEMIRHDALRVSAHAQACLDLAHEHETPIGIALGTFLLGWARWQLGDRDGEAGMREGAVLLAARRMGTMSPLFMTALAEAEASAGRLDAGLARLDAELATIEQSGQHWFDAEVHRTRGELLLQRAPSDAETAFMRAIEIARNQQARTFELRAATSLARLWRDQNKRTEAHDLLAPVYGWFTEGFDTLDLKQAKALLEQLKA